MCAVFLLLQLDFLFQGLVVTVCFVVNVYFVVAVYVCPNTCNTIDPFAAQVSLVFVLTVFVYMKHDTKTGWTKLLKIARASSHVLMLK